MSTAWPAVTLSSSEVHTHYLQHCFNQSHQSHLLLFRAITEHTAGVNMWAQPVSLSMPATTQKQQIAHVCLGAMFASVSNNFIQIQSTYYKVVILFKFKFHYVNQLTSNLNKRLLRTAYTVDLELDWNKMFRKNNHALNSVHIRNSPDYLYGALRVTCMMFMLYRWR